MKSILTVAVTVTACAVLSACSLAQKAMPGATMSDADVLGVLNAINRGETDEGRLAKEKASSQEVQAYASRMVNEHQMRMQDTNQLARRISMEPQKPALASTLENSHEEAMEELRQKSGLEFDKAYIEHQIEMHRQAISLVEDTTDSVNDPQLKRFLRGIRPDLQNHLASAQSVQRQVLARE